MNLDIDSTEDMKLREQDWNVLRHSLFSLTIELKPELYHEASGRIQIGLRKCGVNSR